MQIWLLFHRVRRRLFIFHRCENLVMTKTYGPDDDMAGEIHRLREPLGTEWEVYYSESEPMYCPCGSPL